MSLDRTRTALLQLYKRLLRSCETFPSKNRSKIYESIRIEWREHKSMPASEKLDQQIAVAYKGLQQLRQYDEGVMSGGQSHSANWTVTLEQNPIPKPTDYEEKRNPKRRR